MQRILIKKRFLFVAGSVCGVQLFTTRGKHFADDEEVETEVRKWLRQQLKDFCVAGFDTLAKRWDKCVSVCGGYVEKQVFFFQIRISHVRFIFICDLCTDSPS
jgi:hypothetical protein